MKKLIAAVLLVAGVFSQAQRHINVSEAARIAHFNKVIDEINNGKEKIKYSDIQGIPYYTANFVPAKAGDTPNTVSIRYNTFLDTIEILNGTDVYEIPKEESYPKFTFEGTKEKLVLVNTHNELAGYFFELAGGKNRLLKKITTKFYEAVPAPNSLITGTPARFETQKPMYFIQTEDGFIKIPKNNKDLLVSFSNKKDVVESFMKSNKTKLTKEADLIKLVNFLNQ